MLSIQTTRTVNVPKGQFLSFSVQLIIFVHIFFTFSPDRYYSQSSREYSGCSSESDDVVLSDIPVSHIRNFCIIAHVDHGKSTLADRLLEFTGAWSPSDHQGQQGPGRTQQVLDKLQVSTDRAWFQSLLDNVYDIYQFLFF